MSKRSEDFLYFQNKAQHYHNIRTARSTVQHQLPDTLTNTIHQIAQQKYNRDLPYNRQYEIQTENKKMAHRLISISHTNRNQVQADGSYCRFNKFQRKFRQLIPFRNEQERAIKIQNQILQKKLASTQAKVGNHSAWEAEFKEKDSFRKRMSRYDDNNLSKQDLRIDKQKFLADPYLKFLNQIQNVQQPQKLNTIDGSRTSRDKSKQVHIDKEKLFILPNLSRTSESPKMSTSKVSISKQSSLLPPQSG